VKVKTELDNEPKHQHQDGLLSNWAKRKQAVLREQAELEKRKLQKERDETEKQVLLTDEDMPPIESLTADSDYTGFMSPEVSDALRRLALRKLFHGAEFNICDGLDDYDGDYASFTKLGSIVTSDMKHQIEMEARKKARLLEEQKTDERLASEKIVLEGKANDDARLEFESELELEPNPQPAGDEQKTNNHADSENEMAMLSKAADTEYVAVGEADNDENNLDGGLPG